MSAPEPIEIDFVVGVDPGLSGAIAIYNTNPARFKLKFPGVIAPSAALLDMPVKDGAVDARALALAMDQLVAMPWAQIGNVVAAVEHVASRPRQQGAFKFGMSTGIVHGVFATLNLPITTIPPSVWKPAMGLRRAQTESEREAKAKSRALAIQLFPDLEPQLNLAKHDGRAEALLIAVYHANTAKP